MLILFPVTQANSYCSQEKYRAEIKALRRIGEAQQKSMKSIGGQ
jgi:hypothetical protein